MVRGFQSHPNGFAGFYLPAVILIVISICTGLCSFLRGKAKKLLFAMFLPMIAFDYYFTYAKGHRHGSLSAYCYCLSQNPWKDFDIESHGFHWGEVLFC